MLLDIRPLRYRLGLTQIQLAEVAGVSRLAVWGAENRRHVRPSTYLKLARFFEPASIPSVADQIVVSDEGST